MALDYHVGSNIPMANGHVRSVIAARLNTPAGIGLEPTLAEHIDNIVAVFREVRRVLRDDGTAWLNYGDAYAGFYQAKGSGWSTSESRPGDGIDQLLSHAGACQLRTDALVNFQCQTQEPMGLPWRVAFALQDDGWYYGRPSCGTSRTPCRNP